MNTSEYSQKKSNGAMAGIAVEQSDFNNPCAFEK